MNFQAELKEVKSKKTASLDIIYRVVFETDNPAVLDLGKEAPDTYFSVEVNNAS